MFLFFLRHFNDIDNMVPVVWKMAREKHPVTVYCLNPRYDINSDYRLAFLKELGIHVDYVYNDATDDFGQMQRMVRSFFFQCFAFSRKIENNSFNIFSPLLKLIGNFSQMIGGLLFSFAKKKYYNRTWASRLIESQKAEALCFDWVKTKLFVINPLVKAANDSSIPILALPHGTFIYTNEKIASDSDPLGVYKKLEPFDAVVVESKLHRKFMVRSGLDNEKIHVLGNARYCHEWIQQNNRIAPEVMIRGENNDKELKLVFMGTTTRWRLDKERMLKTFDLLTNFDGIKTLVKPHTRGSKEAYLYQNLSHTTVSNIYSVELCKWADIILVIGSSIILEPLIQRKPALYLKYLHKNTTSYEEYKACWIINSEDELKAALTYLKRNKNKVPYLENDVKRFIADMVYNGKMDNNILKDYADFIVSFKKRHKIA